MTKCKSCNFENICTMPDFVRNNLKNCKVYEPKKKQTNADKIRAMNDEELAEFLVDVETHGYHDQSVSGTLEMIDWLQSEAEEQ